MAKITLEVDEKNLSTVLLILNNLKRGLIKNIDSNKKSMPKPISSSINNTENRKYLSREDFKNRLKGK